ncbi:protein vraC, partial [Staphylococcus epidermidis]|uniref:protein vraC n=1 Tax=Staphylococcus epidermidis TaxID=1282 RepID=UPI00119E55B2
MHLYFKDPIQITQLQFTNEQLQNYSQFLNINYHHYLPTLISPNLSPQFHLFQSFSNKPIILKHTHINTQHQLQLHSTYQPTFHNLSQKLIKNIIKYTYPLQINKHKKHSIYIKQIFIH